MIRTAFLAAVFVVTPVAARPSSVDAVAPRIEAAWVSGDPTRAPLAVNVLLDQDAERRRAEIAALKEKVGACAMAEPVVPVSAMEGRFAWTCATGKVAGRVQMAPKPALRLQVLSFAAGK